MTNYIKIMEVDTPVAFMATATVIYCFCALVELDKKKLNAYNLKKEGEQYYSQLYV